MNGIYKLYCRCFQQVFHLAIPLLPYRNPEVLTGTKQVPAALKKRGVTHVLLVTDEVLCSLGKPEPLKQALANAGIRCTVYDRVVPNPTVRSVEDARGLYLDKGCDGLIGFGGGSAIDCAKAVGARIARPRKSLQKMGGILGVVKKLPPLVAVPTTSGTGSEVTVTTVITDSETGHKVPISDFPLIPAVAVLDVENTKTMPRGMTATTGMDALTHAVEAYIGGSTTRSTRADALEATRLVFAYLERAYRDGSDEEARQGMMQAAFLAGRAFSKSYVGYIHAVAHSLGGQYNIPHGLANAVLLPIGLELYGDKIATKLHRLAIAAGIATAEDETPAAAKAFLAAIRAMNQAMNIPDTLTGIREEDIPRMAHNAAREANPLYPVPVLMDEQELQTFYYRVSDRRKV